MPKYIPTLLKRLQHSPPLQSEYSPHAHQPFDFHNRKKRQLLTTIDTSPLLTDKKDIKHIQSIVGSLLYYARTIDNTIYSIK